MRDAEKSIEYLALDNILKQKWILMIKVLWHIVMMDKKQGTGSFKVQCAIIDGNYRALPTMPVASQNKSNLA